MGGKGSTLLCYEERVIIEQGLKDGLTIGTIATMIGRTHSCVKQEIIRRGGRKTYTAKGAQELADKVHKARIQKLCSNFNESTLECIHACVGKGMSKNQISNACGVSHHSLTIYFKRSGIVVNHQNYKAFEERITALEMQIEFLIEELEKKEDKK